MPLSPTISEPLPDGLMEPKTSAGDLPSTLLGELRMRSAKCLGDHSLPSYQYHMIAGRPPTSGNRYVTLPHSG